MKFKNSFSTLTKFEWGLWSVSSLGVLLSHLLSPQKDILSVIASLIGVTALIFVAKGHVLGQLLTIVFAIFYGVISFQLQYYGEVITYVCMSAPMALLAAIAWIKHPYQQSEEVAVSSLSKRVAWWLDRLDGCRYHRLLFHSWRTWDSQPFGQHYIGYNQLSCRLTDLLTQPVLRAGLCSE